MLRTKSAFFLIMGHIFMIGSFHGLVPLACFDAEVNFETVNVLDISVGYLRRGIGPSQVSWVV